MAAGTLYIVRHGKTALNRGDDDEDRIRGWKDVPLDAEGRQEAAQLGKTFAGVHLDAIYSSDLSRASDTADAIANTTGVRVRTDKAFRPWNLGDFQGDPSKDVHAKLRDYIERHDEKVPGGESFDDFSGRFLPAFTGLLDQVKDGKTIAVVTHYRDLKLAESWLVPPQGEITRSKLLTDDTPTGSVLRVTWDSAASKWAWAKENERATVKKVGYPTLVRSHVRGGQLDPGVEAELAYYFQQHPDIRAGEAADHGFDPTADPRRYLAAEKAEGYHDSLKGTAAPTLADIKVWEAEEDRGYEQLRKEQPDSGSVHVDAPLGSDARAKKRKPADVDDLDVKLLKADEEQRLVYGIVLEPDVEDSQGDVVSKEDVELAAHRFLYQQNPIGDQHRALAPGNVRPVESYVAPCDFELGGQPVRKGSWVLVAHIPDDRLWEQVRKGEKGAWSVGGTGRRSPL